MVTATIRAALTQRRYGSRQTDVLLRITAILSAAAIPATLLVPDIGTLMPFVLFSMWTNGPWSPVLPASHEPVLMLYGRLYHPLLVGVIATAAIVLVEWVNYYLYAAVADLRALRGVRNCRTVTRLTRLFNRQPFITVVVAAVTPVPFWIVRALAAAERYPLRRYLPATALGRFPRLCFFAALGTPLAIPDSWLVIATVGSIIAGIGLVIGRGALGRVRQCAPDTGAPAPGIGRRTVGVVAAVAVLLLPAVRAYTQEDRPTGRTLPGLAVDAQRSGGCAANGRLLGQFFLGLGGALLGAHVGAASSRTSEGAILGAIAGSAGGAAVGVYVAGRGTAHGDLAATMGGAFLGSLAFLGGVRPDPDDSAPLFMGAMLGLPTLGAVGAYQLTCRPRRSSPLAASLGNGVDLSLGRGDEGTARVTFLIRFD
jgi:uncharacterized membrane protein YdjX (TVP38/TMEM64 family)